MADSDSEFLKAINEEKAEVINVLEKYKNAEEKLDFERFITEIKIDEDIFEFSLFGDYQFKNFLCAYEAALELGIAKEIIKEASKKVIWQCRFERYSTNPLVVLDGAHNPDGMMELKKVVEKGYKPEEVAAIVSILKDKDVKSMLEILKSVSSTLILTSLAENPRGTSGDEIYNQLSDTKGCSVENDLMKAYKNALAMNKKIILICGSFYLLSKFKEEVNE